MLINEIYLYLNTYSMKADLLFYRGKLYKTLKMNESAYEDFKISASCACFQNFSDIKPLSELALINAESGRYEEAIYILNRAKTSLFCTVEKAKQIDADILYCKKKMAPTLAVLTHKFPSSRTGGKGTWKK